MLIRFSPAIERVLLTLWVGSLWAIGMLVAPALFSLLDDRALAGTIAGNLFMKVAYLGLFCGAVLLLINTRLKRGNHWRVGVLVAMLVLVVLGQFVLAPMIADLRMQGLVESAWFGRLHGLAGVFYLAVSVLGLVLVVARQRPEDHSSSL